MPVEIRVPAMGESVTEAVVGQWLKKPGDPVEADEVAVDVPAEQAGILAGIQQQEGATVHVGDVLAVLTTSDEPAAVAAPVAAPAIESATMAAGENGATAPRPAPLATPVAQRLAAEKEIDLAQVAGTGIRGRVTKDDVATYLIG